MTKLIRIENADTSDAKVVVETWEKRMDGGDVLINTTKLDHPTMMLTEHIWANRYLVIREPETKKEDKPAESGYTGREYMSVHDAHCCPKHGCKYGDLYCPVAIGKEPGIKCEYCYEDDDLLDRLGR